MKTFETIPSFPSLDPQPLRPLPSNTKAVKTGTAAIYPLLHNVETLVLHGDWTMLSHVLNTIAIYLGQARRSDTIKVFELLCKYQQQHLMETVERMHEGQSSHHQINQVYLQHQCHQIMFAMRSVASQKQQISLQHLIQCPEQLPLYKKHLFGLSPVQSVQCVRNILAHDVVNTLASLDPNILSMAFTTLPVHVKQQPFPYPHGETHNHPMTSNFVHHGTRIPECQKNETLPERVLSPSDEFTSSSVLSTSSSSSDSNVDSSSNDNSSPSRPSFSSEDSYARPLKKRRISFVTSREEEHRSHPSVSRSHRNEDLNCPKQQQTMEHNEQEQEGTQSTSTRPIKPTSKLMKLGITSTPTLRKRMIKVLFENRHEEPMVWDEILSKIPGNRAKIWSTLCLFVNEGFVVQSGKGRRGFPFKYELAEFVTEEHFETMEPQWKIIDAEGKVVHKALQEERRRKRRLLKQQSNGEMIDRHK